MPLIILLMKTMLNALILGCIFLSVTPIMASAQSDSSELISGPQVARIIVPRAIVYSDENMSSPVGYISNDKLITVGNPRKKNPDLVPLVIYGRLAFIEIKNIHYENAGMELQNSKRGAPKEHNIDLVLTKPEEKLSENNSAYIHLHQFYAGDEVSNLFETVNGEAKSNFTGFGLTLLHRQLISKVFWGAALEYNSISTTNLDFNTTMLSGVFGYTPIRNPLFLVDLSFSLDFSVNSKIDLKTNYVNEPAPFFYGPQLLSRIVFFPGQKYHLTGTLSYKSYRVMQVESLVDANNQPINGLTSASGLNLAIGFAIEI